MASSNQVGKDFKTPARSSTEAAANAASTSTEMGSNTTDSEPKFRERAESLTWTPSVARSQSWSQQDLKHDIQQKEMGSGKGQTTGYTES
ncbi:MAG: hypothetical protein M1834_009189 [Cirrosporium novae-zelandiae]|nr:MAG: hypothetical protein M1834_009189 [Cirrosporium novae-zelandiae]